MESIIEVEFLRGTEAALERIDSCLVEASGIRASYQGEALERLMARAASASGGAAVRHLAYRDDEGDWCTLTTESILDALEFTEAAEGSGIKILRLRVVLADVPEADAEGDAQRRVERELERIGDGLDPVRLIPKLASAGLRLVEDLQHPALFPLIDVLSDFRDGRRPASAAPGAVPGVLAAARALPCEQLVGLEDLVRYAAEAAAEELRREMVDEALAAGSPTEAAAPRADDAPAAGGAPAEEAEVHPGATCGTCRASPILGARYKSLEVDEFDLCETCYDGLQHRDPRCWVRVRARAPAPAPVPERPAAQAQEAQASEEAKVEEPAGMGAESEPEKVADPARAEPDVTEATPAAGTDATAAASVAAAHGEEGGASIGAVARTVAALIAARGLGAASLRAALQGLLRHGDEGVRRAAAAAVLAQVVGRAALEEAQAGAQAEAQAGAQADVEVAHAEVQACCGQTQAGSQADVEVAEVEVQACHGQTQAASQAGVEVAEVEVQACGGQTVEAGSQAGARAKVEVAQTKAGSQVEFAEAEVQACRGQTQAGSQADAVEVADVEVQACRGQAQAGSQAGVEVSEVEVQACRGQTQAGSQAGVEVVEAEVQACHVQTQAASQADVGVAEVEVQAQAAEATEATEATEAQLEGAVAAADGAAAQVVGASLWLPAEAEELSRTAKTGKRHAEELAAELGSQVYVVGKVSIAAGTEGSEVPVFVTVTVRNCGDSAWPATSALSLVGGPDLGFPGVPLGAVEAGADVEVAMDLVVPTSEMSQETKSVWAFIDASVGRRFDAAAAPLLVFEASAASADEA